MAIPVTRYRLLWDTVGRRGEITFLAGNTPIRFLALSPDEFNSLALLFPESNLTWDGRRLWTDSGAVKGLSQDAELAFPEIKPEAQKVIDVCENEWPANKGDCSGFVKDVASTLGITLTGQADDIFDQITGNAWTQLQNGNAAAMAANAGKLVIGGLRGDMQQTPQKHGHVVVVVSGPLANNLYPTAYWGTLGGIGESAKTINWAWKSIDRDKVKYAARSFNAAV